MTKLGTRKAENIAVPVSSVGLGPTGGWSEVSRLRGSELSSSNNNWAFVVWGRMGTCAPTGPVENSLIEVILGDQTGNLQFQYRAACGLNHAHLRNALTGHPFFFLIVLDGVLGSNWFKPGVGPVTVWNTEDDIVLYARIAAREEGIGGTFWVSDLNWLAFDLDELNASGDFYAEQVTYELPQFNNIESEGFKDWFATSAPIGNPGEEWLHFWYWHYNPQVVGEPDWTQLGYLTAGSFANFVPLVGTERLGRQPLGPPHQTGSEVTYHWGGWWPLEQPPGSGFAIGLRSRDRHPFAGVRSTWHAIRTFSVRIEKFAYYRSATHAEFEDVTSRQSFERFLPFEISIPAAADYTVLHQGIVQRDPAFADRCFTPFCLAEGTFRLVRPAVQRVGNAYAEEGTLCQTMIPEALSSAGSAVESRYRFHYWERYEIPAFQFNELWDVLDVATVGFYMDDDPQSIPLPPGQQLPPIIVTPGREALGLSQLNELPLAPEVRITLEDSATIIEHVSDQGVRRTWPKFVGVRGFFRWDWNGLTVTERQTLEAFIEQNPTFKWTPPHENAQAFAWITRPEFLDLGRKRYAVSLDVAQLIHIGPGA